MKYNITITDIDTGEIVENIDTNAIIAGIDEADGSRSLGVLCCNPLEAAGACLAALRAIKNARENAAVDILVSVKEGELNE